MSKAMNIEDTLARVPLFSQLSRWALRRLAKGAVRRQFARGDVIVKEGEQAVAFFFILSGRVEVAKGAEGPSPKVLSTLGPGDFLGEMALIDDYLRSATVRALEDTECLELWPLGLAVRTAQEPVHRRGDAARPQPLSEADGCATHDLTLSRHRGAAALLVQ